MNRKIIAVLLLCFSAALIARSQHDSKTLSIGEYFEFDSKALNEKRRLNIYLPQSYHPDSSKNYPVIYLLDGSMDEDFIHIAGLVQFCSFSWINIIPESIVVGISNVDRKRDFTYPTTVKRDKEDLPTAGGSEKFIAFIETELIPEINSRYNTDTLRTIIGQSLGGLLATEILLKKPDLFDNYMIISPSLWWDDESLLALKAATTNRLKQIYIGVGKEGELMERVADELFQKLASQKWRNLQLNFEFFPEKTHGDVLHQAIYNGFQKVF